jgi:hypothetical protein
MGSLAEAKKALKAIGIEAVSMHWYADFSDTIGRNYLIDRDNPNSPDFKNSSYMTLRKDFEGKGIFVVAHQHCQPQLYRTVKKIEDEFGESFTGYDGGGDFDELYKDWKFGDWLFEAATEKESKEQRLAQVQDYQTNLRKWVRFCLADEQFKTKAEDLFSMREIAENDMIRRYRENIENSEKKDHPRRKKPVNVPLMRRRYLMLFEMTEEKLLPNKMELAGEQSDGDKMERYFAYELDKVTATLYALLENKIAKEAFLNELWK